MALAQFIPQALCIISAVGKKPLGLMPSRQKATRPFEIVNVSCRDQQGMRAAEIVGQGVDLGRLPATRAADGVVERPPFAPAAERWALM